MSNPTCFVVMGFHEKTDPGTGRKLNMDATYEFLIKPVLKDLSITCIRADEIPHAGVIDVPMYEWLYKADLVIADISTANANAIYELGIRHALKPYTTIVMAENQILQHPFDLSHLSIMPYLHLGTDIGASTVRDFTKQLKDKIIAIIDKTDADSPVYTFLKGMKQPEYSADQPVATQAAAIPLSGEAKPDQQTLATYTKDAEAAKDAGEYGEALTFFKKAMGLDPNNAFLRQRMALCTYKSKQPDPLTALSKAEELLQPLGPETTTDPETLGLSGAINKRRYDLTQDKQCLQKAIRFYERGFYVKQDYYNGINVAYLYNVAAKANPDPKEAEAQKYLAAKIRQEVITICENIMQDKQFKERSDRPWVYLTLAEGYFGLGKTADYQAVLNNIDEKAKTDPVLKSNFNRQAFEEQLKKLSDLL